MNYFGSCIFLVFIDDYLIIFIVAKQKAITLRLVNLTTVVVPWYISISSEHTAFFSLTEAYGWGFVPTNFYKLIIPEAIISCFVKKHLSRMLQLFDNVATLIFIQNFSTYEVNLFGSHIINCEGVGYYPIIKPFIDVVHLQLLMNGQVAYYVCNIIIGDQVSLKIIRVWLLFLIIF